LEVETGKSITGTLDQNFQTNATELDLKRAASDISNKSHPGGVLKQIRDFNAFLERAALALEIKTY